jgi:hypothetical protein
MNAFVPTGEREHDGRSRTIARHARSGAGRAGCVVTLTVLPRLVQPLLGHPAGSGYLVMGWIGLTVAGFGSGPFGLTRALIVLFVSKMRCRRRRTQRRN